MDKLSIMVYGQGCVLPLAYNKIGFNIFSAIILHFYKDINLLDKSFVTVEAGIVPLYFMFKALNEDSS